MTTLLDTPRIETGHIAFHADEEREHDGLVTELAPNEDLSGTLEDLIIGHHGKAEEDAMRMLVKSGML